MSITEQLQQQQPIENLDVASTNLEVGNPAEGEQAPYKRVTAEEAATLPYDELKRRMKEERRLYEEGLLTATDASAGEGDDENPDANLEGDGAEATGRDNRQEGTRSGGEGGGATQQGDPNLAKLLQQAQERNAQLERERAEAAQKAERENLQAQHQRVEQAIARLPEERQQLARQDYMNRLGQQALNDYHGYLSQREQHIRQAEIVYARREIPSILGELADSVAQRHGLRNADALKQYVTSAEFKELLDAANTEEALTSVAANAGQWMEFLAVQQATQNATMREHRRQKAAANPRVARDTPGGGVPTAGGDVDLVRRIQTMSKEEFFKWKKDQLRAAQASA